MSNIVRTKTLADVEITRYNIRDYVDSMMRNTLTLLTTPYLVRIPVIIDNNNNLITSVNSYISIGREAIESLEKLLETTLAAEGNITG